MIPHPIHPAITAVLAVARQLNETRLQDLVAILESGQLKLETSVGRIQYLLHCPVNEARLILTMLRHWRQQERDEQGLADALQTAWLACATMLEETPEVNLVWTGPVSLPNLAHTTGGVLLKLIDEAREEVVIVNYALSVSSRLARSVIEHMARASRRGVQIVLIGNRLEENQLEVLRKHWPNDLAFPLLYTYRGDARDSKAALHAKAIVVDARSLLTTSANLSYHGLEGSIELGLLATGRVAQEAREVLMALIEEGVCVKVE